MDLPMASVKNHHHLCQIVITLTGWIVLLFVMMEKIPGGHCSEEKKINFCPTSPNCHNEGPFCSNEGKTYLTKCDLEKDWCKTNGTVKAVFNHACSKCFIERRANLLVKMESDQQSGKEILIPDCDNKTGLYKSTQCHKETGYCWCVDVNNGKPQLGTSLQGDHAAVDCEDLAKTINRRRRPRRDKKKCSKIEKDDFIRALMESFSAQYEKIFEMKEVNVKAIVKWKFSHLDLNMDNYLSRREVKDFRHSIVKLTTQPACASSFFRVVDHNSDKMISRSEWMIFFSGQQHEPERFRKPERPRFQTNPSDLLMWSSNLGSSARSVLNGKSEVGKSDGNKEISEDDDDEDDVADIESIVLKPNCSESRLIALKNAKNFPFRKTFIPSCNTKDPTLYQEVQCHEQTGWCFCVKSNSGTPLRGISSTLPEKPDCQQGTVRTKLSNPQKGCSPQKALRFKRFLIKNFQDELRRRNPLDKSSASVHKVSLWKFMVIDSNHNSIIEPEEWNNFKLSLKELIDKNQNYKKCARNLLTRECDSNQDDRIESSEWKNCLFGESQRQERQTISDGKRKGRNPFLPILKAD